MCTAAREARQHAGIASKLKAHRDCVLRQTTPQTKGQKMTQGKDIWTFTDQHTDSVVVPMSLDRLDVHKLMARMDKLAALSAKVSAAIIGKDQFRYNALSFQFENAALFHPECGRLWENNEERMRKHMPSLVRCHCNAFLVRSPEEAYEMHHASNLGYEVPVLAQRGIFAPLKHMSFHTALHETNATTGPFTVFDNHIPELWNTYEMTVYLQTNLDVQKGTRCEMQAVNSKLVHVDKRELEDYTSLLYWEHQACAAPDEGGHGKWWSLRAGDAIHFNNWRAHSDAFLGTVEQPRYTLDLRCFGPMQLNTQESPNRFPNANAFLQQYFIDKPDNEFVSASYYFTGCLPLLFNLTAAGFLALFPGIQNATVQEMVGSIVGNLIDRPEISLVHQSSQSQAYYALVERTFAEDSFDVDSLIRCIKLSSKKTESGIKKFVKGVGRPVSERERRRAKRRSEKHGRKRLKLTGRLRRKRGGQGGGDQSE
jgi:hypothetical protein